MEGHVDGQKEPTAPVREEAGVTGISMVLVLLLGQVPGRGAGELVGQLGSSRYDEREAAAAALEKMGLDALPALRDGRESKDPELRNRSEAIIARIRRREQDRAEAAGAGSAGAS